MLLMHVADKQRHEQSLVPTWAFFFGDDNRLSHICYAQPHMSSPVSSVYHDVYFQMIAHVRNIIATQLKDGLQIHDAKPIAAAIAQITRHFSTVLTPEERRALVIDMLYYVIDNTDTPWLPDDITDPIMKAMVPAIVDCVL